MLLRVSKTMASRGGVSGELLDEEMMQQFSGEDDVGKADMLVLRGLGLVNVAVSVLSSCAGARLC